MDSNGRQRNHSSHVTLPTSSTFRRLPTLGRSPFRRTDKASSPSPEAKPSGDISSHQRVSTFPSLSKMLVDENSASSTFYATATPLAGSSGQLSEAEEVDVSNGNQLLPPSRTSSLPHTPSSQVNDPFNSSDTAPLRPGKSTSRDISAQNPLPTFSSDLETIYYPAHLAQTRPPEEGSQEQALPTPVTGVRPTRHRDFTMGSGATILLGAVHSSRGDPGSGGPPMGVPRRKGSVVVAQGNDEESDSFAGPSSHPMSSRSASGSRRPLGVSSTDGNDDRNGQVDGMSESTTRRRRGTRPGKSHGVALGDQDDPDVRGERIWKGNTSRDLPLRFEKPLLPSAKGLDRVPPSAMYFSPLPFHGRPPNRALRAHTGTLVGERICFIGGADSKTCWKGVAWFDTESMLWSTVETFGEQLSPLRAHTATLVGPRLYIFGGGDGPTYSNDVWVFDIHTHRFSRPVIISPRGSVPPPRRAHTTILYRNFLVVFGGGNGQAALNDVWALDVSGPDRLSWQEWRTTGDVPPKKGYHTANLIGDKMIVFGGSDGHASFADIHVLNLQTLTWTVVSTEVKHNRLSHTATQVGSYLFIIGGHNGQTYAQDILLLNLVTLQWESKTPRGITPPGRGYHVALLNDARIFISGGYNGVSVFDDLWVVDLSASAYLPQVTSFEVNERGERMAHQ